MPAKKAATSRSKSSAKKSPAKKSPAKASAKKSPAKPREPEAQPRVVEEDDEAYTLDELVKKRGEATEQEVLAYVSGLDKADLVGEGRTVATRRIDKDAARLYGKVDAFLRKATEAQRDAVMGVSDDLFRAAVWAAHHGSELAKARAHGVSTAGSAKAARVTGAAAARSKGLAVRNQLVAALRSLSGGDAKVLEQIDTAYGVAATAEQLATSIEALIKIGKALLADSSPGAQQRRRGTRLSGAKLDAFAKIAEDVRRAGKAAGAVIASADVAQADVDYWDGVNLWFIELIIDAFEAGHDVDPAVPRLVTISLSGYFSPRRRKTKKEGEEKTPP